MANQSKLKAWVRYDGTGRVVTAGPIFQANKPKVGNWKQINSSLCCNPSGSTTTTTTTITTITSTTTTTTSFGLFSISGGYYSNNGSAICSNPINLFSPLPNAYCTTPTLQNGSYLYNGNSTSSPIIGGLYLSNVQGEVFQTSYDYPGMLVAFPC